ncbi:MAG: hypothetical protein A2152_04210 [Candidatus Levybacteria bacterium RBG_16_35_6]|uniref:Peptidase M11 gametolysin domain-containing protein n=1 Tax=Candidatus Woesebacteria bacterium RBG_13_36_22 TaxID=1802478 RepID=A0A1F7X088_9BACT|nr:MAG: hypothetical protein A2152_04210 [Candidatus Levybacteria bacterium RBG_16_35_6]OGM08514.1 MAG: hypothetical protein A2Z67_02170 [Candidatus Woesebacteria bacterium RBG_13_36_22]
MRIFNYKFPILFKSYQLKICSLSLLLIALASTVISIDKVQNITGKAKGVFECSKIDLNDLNSSQSQLTYSQKVKFEKSNAELFEQINEFIKEPNISKKNAKTTKIVETASARKKEFIIAMKNDPQNAVNYIFNLPESSINSFNNCFEEEEILEGNLEVANTDNFDEGYSITEYNLKTADGRNVHLNPIGDVAEPLLSGTKIRVKGLILDEEMLFDASRPTIQGSDILGGIDIISQPGNPPVLGEQKVIVAPIYFLDSSPLAYTPEQIKDYTITKLNDFYTEVSFNKINVTGDVLDWIQLPINKTCDWGRVQSYTISAIDSQVYFPNYGRLVIMGYPCLENRGTLDKETKNTGDGIVSFSTAWINTSNFTNSHVIFHEFGHNLGVNHADLRTCGNTPLAPTGCSVIEYGDQFDVMGHNTAHLNAPHKEALGWFDTNNIIKATTNRSFSIEPIETISSGLKSIKIQRSLSDYIYVEFRQPIGYDNNFYIYGHASAYEGALMHIIPSYWLKPQLFDPLPSIQGYQLAVGSTLTDPSTGSTVTVTNKTNNLLSLNISIGKNEFISPSVSFIYPTSGSTLSGVVNISANASDDSGIQKIEFYMDTPYDMNKIINIDTEAPYEFSFDTRSVSNGSHTIYTKAFDKSGEPWSVDGNSRFTGVSVIFYNDVINTPTPTPTPTRDITPPIISITNPANGEFVTRNTSVNITANSSDNVAVSKLEFFVNGSLKCTDATSPYSCIWKVPTKSKTIYTILVKSYDTSNNVSQNSITVTSK